jgi:Arc/MetJ-type ribon-helix-helix transcriptional regulator
VTVTIPDEFDTFVDELLVSGSYSSLGTIIRDGLILLHLKRLRAAALPQYMSAGQKSFLDDVFAYVLTREIPQSLKALSQQISKDTLTSTTFTVLECLIGIPPMELPLELRESWTFSSGLRSMAQHVPGFASLYVVEVGFLKLRPDLTDASRAALGKYVKTNWISAIR